MRVGYVLLFNALSRLSNNDVIMYKKDLGKTSLQCFLEYFSLAIVANYVNMRIQNIIMKTRLFK